MTKFIGWLGMKLLGWRFVFEPTKEEMRKCVIVCAPHTSNWDFIYAVLAFWYYQIPMKVFIKDDYTKGFLGWFVKRLGGIGVDRSKRNNLVPYAIELFREPNDFCLLVTPEGTRKFTKKWRRGFYEIAKGANVPVFLGYVDYKNKIGGVGRRVELEGRTFEEVMEDIQSFYRKDMAKYPEQYNEKIF